MAQVSIASVVIPDWQGVSDSVSLYIYATSEFTSSTGTMHQATVTNHLPYASCDNSGTFFQAHACSVGVTSPPTGTGLSVTVPAVVLDSTTDSSNPAALYSAVLWDVAAGVPIQSFGPSAGFSLAPSPSSTTWAAVFAANNVIVSTLLASNVRTVTAADTATTTDSLIRASGTFVETLPATPVGGATLTIKNIGTGTITIASNGHLIDGQSTFSLPVSPYGDEPSVTLQFDANTATWNVK